MEDNSRETQLSPEKTEELKLKQKYPQIGSGAKGAPSKFLQSRLQSRNQKYFDSGDYNMAKAKNVKLTLFAQTKSPPTSSASEMMQTLQVESDPDPMVIGTMIPTPDTVPLRKSSIIQQDVASKLSPQPHLHSQLSMTCDYGAA